MAGTGSSKYIPRPVIEFCMWGRKMLVYASANHERWGVAAPAASLMTKLDALELLADKCKLPTHSRVDLHDRNNLRKEVERDIRDYLQGLVMRNVNVTNHDRDMMMIPVRDTKPSPVGDPSGLVTAVITYPQEGALELRIKHVEGTPFDRRANYGVKIMYDVLPLDAAVTDNADDLYRSVFTRRKKETFTFMQEERRKKAVFCLRYENSKGRAGQWSTMIHAIIP